MKKEILILTAMALFLVPAISLAHTGHPEHEEGIPDTSVPITITSKKEVATSTHSTSTEELASTTQTAALGDVPIPVQIESIKDEPVKKNFLQKFFNFIYSIFS